MKIKKSVLVQIIKQQCQKLTKESSNKKKTVKIDIDWNSSKSIKDAQKKKTKLQNDGYTLVSTVGGLTTSQLVYELSQELK